ncbi:MAG: hypothetical protein NC489_08935 [Ruminococcus flavefaciens]|nr:hypothetical protein [Ruminococcus flavefaciens]
MNTNFPKSIFSNATLRKVAGGFDIPPEYFIGTDQNKRKFAALSYRELENVWRKDEHPISSDEMMWVVDMYHKMTLFDAYFLTTRLPLRVVVELTGMPKHCAAALKRACNYLRDMPEEEYLKRDTGKPVYRHFKYTFGIDKTADTPHTMPKVVATTPHKPQSFAPIPYEFADDKDEIIKKLRPYMNENGIKKMPTTVKLLFKSTPKHVLKRIWSGKNFEKCYASITR